MKHCKFGKNKLDFKGHPQRIPKPIGNQIYFVGFSPDAELLSKKWSQKVKLFWKYIVPKNQTIWLAVKI